MTAITVGYFLVLAVSNWILQQFAAEPRLGPIFNPVTFFQPLQFPILFFVPAIAMDLIMQKVHTSDWTKSLLLSIVFVGLLLLAQYPLSTFLLESPLTRNKFFGSASWTYNSDPAWEYRYALMASEMQPLPKLLTGLLMAAGIGYISARISLRWGKWMTSIAR